MDYVTGIPRNKLFIESILRISVQIPTARSVQTSKTPHEFG